MLLDKVKGVLAAVLLAPQIALIVSVGLWSSAGDISVKNPLFIVTVLVAVADAGFAIAGMLGFWQKAMKLILGLLAGAMIVVFVLGNYHNYWRLCLDNGYGQELLVAFAVGLVIGYPLSRMASRNLG
jgi:hypothetical protein